MFAYEGSLIRTFLQVSRGEFNRKTLIPELGHLLKQNLYRVCGYNFAPRLSVIRSFRHAFVQPFPDCFVHSAVSSGRELHALTLEVINKIRRHAKPLRHGRLSTAPCLLVAFWL